jgi:hypothetical protein
MDRVSGAHGPRGCHLAPALHRRRLGIGHRTLSSSVSLFYLGELKLLREGLPVFLEQVEARDDLYQGGASRLSHVSHLAADQPDKDYEEIERALARWPRQHNCRENWGAWWRAWRPISIADKDAPLGNTSRRMAGRFGVPT